MPVVSEGEDKVDIKDVDDPQIEEREYDKDRVVVVVVVERAFVVLVRADKVVDLDIEYKRQVHLEFQGPVDQIFIFSCQQFDSDNISVEEYRDGSELLCQVFS